MAVFSCTWAPTELPSLIQGFSRTGPAESDTISWHHNPRVRIQGYEFLSSLSEAEMWNNGTTRAFAMAIIGVCAIRGFASNQSNAADTKHKITFTQGSATIAIEADGAPLATYVFQDPEIPRPYFKNLCAPGGAQVTRHYPPREGLDPLDHERFHPGLWLAFGDISGVDFWRNKASIEHVGFVKQPPTQKGGKAGFTVHNRYWDGNKTICREFCEYTFLVRPAGYLILWDSTFRSDNSPFYFGDQEEMGIGVRVATPIMVMSHEGGRILDSEGRKNEEGIWGKQAQWCDYGGRIDGTFAGITVMPDPDNGRPCHWHVRDYGLMVANPFGQKAFDAETPSKLSLEGGQRLHLGFGILIHAASAEGSVDLATAYQDYIDLSK